MTLGGVLQETVVSGNQREERIWGEIPEDQQWTREKGQSEPNVE